MEGFVAPILPLSRTTATNFGPAVKTLATGDATDKRRWCRRGERIDKVVTLLQLGAGHVPEATARIVAKRRERAASKLRHNSKLYCRSP
jgi:hypothetical protein